MTSAAVCVSIFYELGQLLRRRVWQPLRRMMEIFHILPLTAAVLVFLLLAYDGQLREIYISYLESLTDPKPGQAASTVADSAATAAGFAAAVAGFALISAILCEAHYRLSTMRINVVYSSLSNPEAGSMLRRVQRWAAIGLALVPWLGLAAGLFGAKDYFAEIYPQLQTAGIDPGQIKSMQELLPKAGIPSITMATIFFALVVGFVVDCYRRHAAVQGVVIGATPFVAIGLFLLLTDLQPEKMGGFQKAGAGLAVVLASAAYYVAYYRLYTMRRGFIYAHPLNPDTGINRQRRRRVALFACAAFPWLAIALYFAIAPCCLEDVADQTVTWSPFPTFQSLPAASRWAIFPVAMTWVAATGLIVATLLDSFRESKALQRMIIVSVAVLMIGASTASWLTVDAIVQLYRLLGPLGSMSVELLFVFAVFTLLAVLSQKSGFPALTLLLLAIVVSALFPVSINVTATALMIVCATLAVMALLSRLWAVAIVAALVVVPGIMTWMEKSRSERRRPEFGAGGPCSERKFQGLAAPTTGCCCIYGSIELSGIHYRGEGRRYLCSCCGLIISCRIGGFQSWLFATCICDQWRFRRRHRRCRLSGTRPLDVRTGRFEFRPRSGRRCFTGARARLIAIERMRATRPEVGSARDAASAFTDRVKDHAGRSFFAGRRCDFSRSSRSVRARKAAGVGGKLQEFGEFEGQRRRAGAWQLLRRSLVREQPGTRLGAECHLGRDRLSGRVFALPASWG